jgi:hypothetical protein
LSTGFPFQAKGRSPLALPRKDERRLLSLQGFSIRRGNFQKQLETGFGLFFFCKNLPPPRMKSEKSQTLIQNDGKH